MYINGVIIVFLYRSFLSFHGESLVDVVISHHWRMIDYTVKKV